MTFSYDRSWADAVGMVRSNLAILVAVAGVFLFLPAYALLMFAPFEQPRGNPNDLRALLAVLSAYYQANVLSFLAVSVANTIGQAALLVLLLDRHRPTVAEALRVALQLALPLFALTMLVNLMLISGFALAIAPGLYLLGRLAVTAPALIAGRQGNPAAALVASWRHTRGLGWRIAGLILMITALGWIALSASTSVLNVIIGLALPADITMFATAFVDAFGGAALSLLLIVLSAAIYRELRPDVSVGAPTVSERR